MNTAVMVVRRRTGVGFAPIIVLLGLGIVTCLTVAALQIVASTGPALVAAGVAAAGGWLVKTTVAVLPLPVLLCVAAGFVMSPWLIAVAAVAFLVSGRGAWR